MFTNKIRAARLKGKALAISLVAILAMTGAATMVAPRNADALSIPPGRIGWEKHNTSPWEAGSKASIPATSSTLVLTGSDWWWARSFVYHAVYSVDSSYGAVGAGIAKYIPLGQTSAVYEELKYEWNGLLGTQGYVFGNPQTGTDYEVYATGLNDGCWNRFTSTLGWDQYCITGFNHGHPSFQATTNTNATSSTKNTIAGSFNTVKYKPAALLPFDDFSNDSGGKYCRELGSTTAYKIEYITTSGANQLKTGTTASTNSCDSRDGLVYNLPG